ncbi:MAG: alkaline phosphatase D family protein [Nitrospirota bacterium]
MKISGSGPFPFLLASALALAVPVHGCTSESRPGLPPNSPFADATVGTDRLLSHGVAAGDVTADSALVWFRTNGPARSQVEWWPEDGQMGSQSMRSAAPIRSAVVATSRARDFTAAVRLTGLTPGTGYRYRILTGPPEGEAELKPARDRGAGRFATAPGPDSSRPLRFVWSGDLGGQGRCRDAGTGYRIFDQIVQRQPAFVLLLGDLIYGDDRCPSPPNVPGGDFLATTLEEYRAKHRYQRGDAALQRLLASVPVYVIWDDHEVRNNFSGPHDPLMPVGRQALLEYWPIGTSGDDEFRLYRRVRYSADLELFILDTRQYRSRNAEPDGPSKTMLGEAQRRWLLEGLAASSATWKVIATSVPLSNPKTGNKLNSGNDSWARGADGTGFQVELRGIVQMILDRRIRNVVWLATDVHYVQINAYDPDRDGATDFHEFICGPLSSAPGILLPPDRAFNPTTLHGESGFLNFGLVTVGPDALGLAIVDEAGRSRFTTTIPARKDR